MTAEGLQHALAALNAEGQLGCPDEIGIISKNIIHIELIIAINLLTEKSNKI